MKLYLVASTWKNDLSRYSVIDSLLKMKKTALYLGFTLCTVLSALLGWKGHEIYADIDSAVISEADAKRLDEAWGKIFIYTDEGTTTTYGTKNSLSAMAEILPGQEIHPPHQHTAEEFMYIIEGNGTWSLNGKTSPAKAGDMLYAKPWDMHGITNTGNSPLRFFVVKFDGKGVPTPKK